METDLANKSFRIGAPAAVLCSVAYAAIEIFASTSGPTAVPTSAFAYSLGIAVLLAIVPWFSLSQLLGLANGFPRFRLISVAAVLAFPAVLIPAFLIGQISAGGWQYFVIAFAQMAAQVFLYLFLFSLKAFKRRGVQ